MRVELINCKAYRTAKRRCPWAVIIARCDHGFMCFQDYKDYRTWRDAK